MREVINCGLVDAILVDGSFMTAKGEPNDIDLVLVVSANDDFAADLQPTAYQIGNSHWATGNRKA